MIFGILCVLTRLGNYKYEQKSDNKSTHNKKHDDISCANTYFQDRTP